MLRCVLSLATVLSLLSEVGRVSLLADPPPKCHCLIIRKDFFLLLSTVGGISTCYPVCVYYFFVLSISCALLTHCELCPLLHSTFVLPIMRNAVLTCSGVTALSGPPAFAIELYQSIALDSMAFLTSSMCIVLMFAFKAEASDMLFT